MPGQHPQVQVLSEESNRTLNVMPVFRSVDLRADVAGELSGAGGRAARARERLRVEAMRTAREGCLVEAAYAYRIVPLDRAPTPMLHAGGEVLYAPRLLPPSGRLTALACVVCTLGSLIEQRVRALFAERRPSLAMALDELANDLLFEVTRRAQDCLHADVARRGLSMAGELRPGDPGLALDAQASVLRLAGADAPGVTVDDRLLMHPRKSTSMVLGVGIDLPPANWSRCDDCPKRATCRAIARVEAQKAAARGRATRSDPRVRG